MAVSQKPKLSDFMNEEPLQSHTVTPTPNDPAEAQVAPLVASPERGRGRPRTKPASRLASFHLPIDLIDKIDAEAQQKTAGNKSLFMIRLLEDYFTNIK